MSNERTNEARDAAAKAAETARNEAPRVVDEAKGRARVAAGSASRALEGAAGKIRQNAERIPGGDRSTKLATGVADSMETAAERAKAQSDPGLKGRVTRFIKNNPARVAVGAGLLAITGLFVKKKVTSEPPADDSADEN